MNTAMIKVGRIAFRHEGEWWVAYHAQLGTMVDATEMARVQMLLVQTEERRNQFIEFVRAVYADRVDAMTGMRPQFPDAPQPAPEHERSSNDR